MIIEAAHALTADGRVIRDVGIVVEDGTITAIEPLAALPAGGERLGGVTTMVLPGLVNAHQHGVPHGLPSVGLPDGPLEPWMVTLLATPAVDPYLAARRTAAQQLRSGTTTTVHVQTGFASSAQDYDEEVRAQLQGYADAGMRVAYAVDLKDRGEPVLLEDRFFLTLPGPLRDKAQELRVRLPPFEELQDVIVGILADVRSGRYGDAVLLLGPSGPVWCSDELFRDIAAFVQTHGIGVTSHVLESPYEKAFGPLAYDGAETVPALDGLGVLGPGFLLAHGCQLTRADADLLATRGASVVTNPGSNLRLHNGVAPVTMLLDAGVNVAVGTDSTSIGDRDDLLDELRLLRALQRRKGAREGAIPPATLARMATANGARAIGRPDLGALAVGCPADLLLVDLEQVVAPGLHPDPLAALLGTAHPQDIDLVLSSGKVVVRTGEPVVPAQLVPRQPASAERLELIEDLMPYVLDYYAAIPIEV